MADALTQIFILRKSYTFFVVAHLGRMMAEKTLGEQGLNPVPRLLVGVSICAKINAVLGTKMLSAKRKSDGQLVLAYFESKANAPFACVDCQEEVILRTGRFRVNHFAHANPLACIYAEGESDTHRRCKMEIFEALQRESRVRNVALERSFGPVRPDVMAQIRGVPVAIEVQMSSLSLDSILNRTIWYARKGIYVLWLLQWTPELDRDRYNPKLWEKWIHAAYFGRVYYWLKGLDVVSYHFDNSLKAIPKTSWYSKDGKRMTGGGYTRRSRRYRRAIRGKTFNLAIDFVALERLWWEGGGLKVPDAKLFMVPSKRRNPAFQT